MLVHESLCRRGSPGKFSSGSKGKDGIDRVGWLRKKDAISRWRLMQATPQQKDGFPRTFAKVDKPKRGVVSGSKDPRSSKPPEEYGSMSPKIARPVEPSVEKEIHMEVDNQGV
ncbi:hypothetical protein Pint_10728 [Pistacia integerrima]|uniref:Uncharacterized protein n=1 Tax=Pistacia integerrima TaxID=434235 RepID=A0ACC0XHS9_9ROSI|nr:hypothetical protein Pint_10728 [Pistacia integerrima]